MKRFFLILALSCVVLASLDEDINAEENSESSSGSDQILSDDARRIFNYVLDGFLIVLGFILIIVGYRLIRVLSVVIAFLIGTVFSYSLIVSYSTLDWYWCMLISFAPGILCAVVSGFIIRVGVFCAGAGAGYFLALSINSLKEGSLITSDWGIIVFYVCMAVVFGALSVFFIKPLFVGVTSFIGTYMVIGAIDTLAGGHFKDATLLVLQDRSKVDPDAITYVEFAMLVVGTIAGIAVQFLFTSRNYNHSKNSSKYAKLDRDLFDN